MAFSSILSLALIQVILYSTTTASTAKTISIQFSKAPAVGSTDNYLLPVSIGANSQSIYLTPSTSTDDTFVNSARTCTPLGNNTNCVQYRGGVFGPLLSSSWKLTDAAFTWKNEEYGLFADGSVGEDTLTFPVKSGNVVVDAFRFGLVDSCNLTSGLLGLGRNSTLLARLVRDGSIGSRAYGLFVGVDGQGLGFGGGVRRVGRRDAGLNATAIRSFPGSLTLGGYDEARMDGTAMLQAPIASDESLRLEVTNVVLRNDAVHDLLNSTREVIIDSSTPYLYLPESTAQQLSYALEAQGGEPGVDFFYGSSADRYIGNVTFTLRIPGSGPSIDVVLPPSVLYQPIATLSSYGPVGNHDHYLPIKAFADSLDQPIVLGRTFLKAAYVFVNHDESVFQLSQVVYNPIPSNTIAATTGTSSSSTTAPTNIAPMGKNTPKHPPIVPIAAAVGGATVVLAFAAIAFLLRRRRQSHTLKPIPSTVTVDEHSSSTPMVSLPSRDEKHPGGPGAHDWGVWEKDGDNGFYTPHPLEGAVFHEMESDHVGMAASPGHACPPSWVELPAEPVPARVQHHEEVHEMI